MLPILLNPQFRIIAVDFTVIKGHWSGLGQKDSFCRLYYPVKGKGRIRVDGVMMDLKPGNLYLIPSDTPFVLYPSDGMAHYWIHFLAGSEAGMNLFTIIGLKECVGEYSENPAAGFSEILERRKIQGLDHEILLNSIFMGMIYTFFREENLVQKVEIQDYQRFAPVLSYVRENYMKPVSSRHLAEIANLHPGYFSSLFSSCFGISPVKYINKVRIDQAQLLLAETDLRINEIARRTGFSNEFYFSETFSQYTGVAPSAYRKTWCLN